MKKMLSCLMIAGLSLFAYPLMAETLPVVNAATEATAPPVVTPAMEKKIDAFKTKHPDMFSKKENKNKSENAAKSHDGGAIYISGGALLLIIILLIIFL
ncbi:hypothetical protein BH11BAC7_BH11BAC7_24730 [soil metagenome]